MGLDPKHAVKQVDRLLSNAGVDVDDLAPYWVSFVIASRTDVVVAREPYASARGRRRATR